LIIEGGTDKIAPLPPISVPALNSERVAISTTPLEIVVAFAI
jgi:hypothetical protein